MTILTVPLRTSSQNPPCIQKILKRTSITNFLDISDQSLLKVVPNEIIGDLNALGTITKFNSNLNPINTKASVKRQSARAANFKLTDTAKELLAATAQKRVCICMSHRLSKDENITIKHNGQSGNDGRAHYSNIIQCSAIHTCITCNNRIMGQRSLEISQAYDYFVNSMEGFVPMLTLTIPHKLNGDLERQIELINQAYKRLMDDRVMRDIWALLGRVGSIKSVEYTYGKNGHHNHIHSLIFIKKSHHDIKLPITRWTTPKRNGMLRLLNPAQEQKHIVDGLQDKITYQSIEDFIKFYWVKLCREVGLGMASLESGAVITEGDNVKSYIAKHKSAQEITNSRDKKAENGNRNQWELLLDYQNGDKQAGIIFREYAQSFSGGKLMRWSNGLKKLLLIEDIEDDDIKDVDENLENKIVEEITHDVWHMVKRYKLQARLLSAVENDYKNDTNEYTNIIERMTVYHHKRLEEQRVIEQRHIKKLVPPKWFKNHHQAM